MHAAIARPLTAGAAAAALGLAGLAGVLAPAHPAAAAPAGAAAARPAPACASGSPGRARCAVLVAGSASVTPQGLGPPDLRDAYGFQSSSEGMRQTVAVVVPYDDPAAEADLAVYRSQFGMPACTTADGCFKKEDENGGASYSSYTAPAGWSVPTSEALDMVSAVCPNCHLLLVEAANTDVAPDLGTAENTAAGSGAKFAVNAWDTPEGTYGSSEQAYSSQYFDHPGVAITAPAGNSYGVTFPAAAGHVTAVGGTVLAKGTGARGWTEAASAQTGSGCSLYVTKPPWQTDTGCAGRTMNDAAAVSDSSTPVAFYDTGDNLGGWAQGGGTTVPAAIVAAAYALGGTPAAGSYPASYPYSHPHLLNDITSGSNGTCSPAYLCAAGTGYDGPTGQGTPASVIPFTASGNLPGTFTSGIFGMCLDDTNNSTTAGNPVQIWTCNGGGAQHWTAEPDGTIQHSGSCLDVFHSGTANDTAADLNACNGSGAQQWRPRSPGALENPQSGKCLDTNFGGTTNGTKVWIFTCNGANTQQWFLPYPIPVTTGPVRSAAATGECADTKFGSTAGGTVVWLFTCNGANTQNVTVAANGTLQIAGKCIDDFHSGTSDGTEIDLAGCNGTGAQQWRAESNGALLNPESGKCLGLTNGSTANDTPLWLYSCDNATTQDWKLP
jgi:hypothetical protein